MKRIFQHILAILFVCASWLTINMLLSTESGKPHQHNHESFFFAPEMEVTDMGGRSSSVEPESLFPLAPLSELGPTGPPYPAEEVERVK